MYNILNIFGSATGAELNSNKTKIMGFGSWSGKTNWNADWLVSESISIKCLGICYFNSWHDTINKNWQLIENKIEKCLRVMMIRQLTIFQKSILVNSCVVSKLIYVASVLPIPQNVAKSITQMIFKYLWNGRYDPIRREALYLPKESGGIGLFNIMIKCNSTLVKTFIKLYSNDDTELGIGLMMYYCDSRLSAIILKNGNDITYNIPNYYMYTLDLCRNIMHLKNFPNVTCKEIYNALGQFTQSYIEQKYPLFRWNQIWTNLHMKYIDKYDRMVCFKFLYEALPTRKKLNVMNIPGIDNDLCPVCQISETNFHLFYFCNKIKSLYQFMLRLCEIAIHKEINDPLCFIYFDFKVTGIKKYLCSVILSSYIGLVWTCRNENLSFSVMKLKLITRIKYNIKTILLCPDIKSEIRNMLKELDTNC